VAALKDQWQQARQQRQQEIIQRRQGVQTTLATWQQSRQQQAVAVKQALVEFHTTLQDETSLQLLQARQQRQVMAKATAQQLAVFVEALRSQTADFLALTSQERQVMAQQLEQDLSAFHQALVAAVSNLRLTLDQQIKQIQADVRAWLEIPPKMLAQYQQDRLEMRAALLDDLSAYVGDLQIQVSTYLKSLTTLRQQQAIELSQQLRQNRQISIAAVETLFGDLAQFRQELTANRANLQTIVWGDGTAPGTLPVTAPATPSPAAKPAAAAATPAPAVVEAPEPEPAPKPLPTVDTPTEAAVLEYVQAQSGAKLTQIETELGLNRFQAVEVLRALIEKNLIQQKDRVYHLVNAEATP
jgi:hypothetical protein